MLLTSTTMVRNGPVILLLDSTPSDGNLLQLLLRHEVPHASIVVADGPLAFVDALEHQPAVAIVAADPAWTSARELIATLKRRCPLSAVILFGSPADLLRTLDPGLALDGVVARSSAGYLLLARLVRDVIGQTRTWKARSTNGRSNATCFGSTLDHMISPFEFPSAMEPPTMSDVPPPFEMHASAAQPASVDGLSPALRNDPPPVREGLPPSFRMRADAHYVESLDTAPLGPKLQLVEVSRIDARDDRRTQAAPALVESIRSVGVLQPLIAEQRNGRFRLLAGDRRLAAARAAGLRDVPCIVRRADEDEATEVTAAANLFVAAEPATQSHVPAPDPAAADAHVELSRALSSMALSLPLLEQTTSNLARGTAINLLKAEVTRAAWLVDAAAALRGDLPLTRGRVPAEGLVTRVLRDVEAERSIRGVVLSRQVAVSQGEVSGDEERLGRALSGVVTAVMELVSGGTTMTITARMAAGEPFSFTVAQASVPLPPAWASRDGSISGRTPATGGAAIAAARRIIEGCGGTLSVRALDFGGEIQIVLPRLA